MSPAIQISARVGSAPFLGRDYLLAELDDWLDSGIPFDTFLIGGHGGSGKTRLAAEIARARTQQDSWIAGFYSSGYRDDAGLKALATLETSRLVVVDYAETRSSEIELLLDRLQQCATVEHPVRVLFLVRTPANETPDGWLKAITDSFSSDDAVVFCRTPGCGSSILAARMLQTRATSPTGSQQVSTPTPPRQSAFCSTGMRRLLRPPLRATSTHKTLTLRLPITAQRNSSMASPGTSVATEYHNRSSLPS